MFYLELKDGEKIFTGDQEDDHAAYRKIIEDKLGKYALTLFEKLFEFTVEKPGDILDRLKAYEDALWDIWFILMDSEEDSSDSDKVKEISKIIIQS